MNIFTAIATFYNSSFAHAAGIMVLGLVTVVTVTVMVGNYRRRKQEERARALVRSIIAHPAGKGRVNQPRVLEATKHIDRPGWDWTSDKL
jgi:hypothetical protein